MSDCAVTRGLTYREENGAKLSMDVYAPSGVDSTAQLPAVMFVHGGPIPADMTPPTQWGIFQSYGELAAASGFIGVTFNHRLFGQTEYDRSQSDVRVAIEYVQSHARDLHVDPQRIAMWIFSGGGPHLSWVLRKPPKGLLCALAFYAILDARPFLPANADLVAVAAVEQLSAVCQINRESDLPLFIARAGLDMPQINQGIDAFVASALGNNMTINISNHAHGRHGFDYLDDDARTRSIIVDAIEFLQRNTKVRAG
jgi:poly(3-hydroxybutyrate) depolymerase